jgi:SagB-type dehydrogenase family enzyme
MPTSAIVRLPQPEFTGEVAVEEALLTRRSVRSFAPSALFLAELSQLLWAAQGVTSARGHRTAPSAGALYPLEVHALVGLMPELTAGVYRYRCREHTLVSTLPGETRGELCRAALGQRCVEKAPLVLLISAVYARMTATYGERGVRYTDMEAGHAAQSICLQAVALGLGSVVVGAFEESDVRRIAGLPPEEVPLYLIPVGR